MANDENEDGDDSNANLRCRSLFIYAEIIRADYDSDEILIRFFFSFT